MALIEIPASDALSNRRGPTAGWGDQHSDNRVTPVALPSFETPFQLVPGEKIFTIGSCFARNVERAMAARGFELPTVDLLRQPRFSKVNPAVVNNYGVPSIFNEFSWALDPDATFDKTANFIETSPGKFADLHIVSTERPQPLEDLALRRDAIIEANRAVADCRVVIMTLGLTELWYDKAQNLYLNSTPMPRTLKQNPERFALHVLDFEESLGFMQRTMDLLRARCRADQQIILTVSPVPIINTFRPNTDVMVANCYSKSCLRTVAEHVCARYDNVHYFPSYESVTLSDRTLAWKDDNIHVTDEIVRINVNRMVRAYCPPDDSLVALETVAEAGGAMALYEEAQKYARGGYESGQAFFEHFAHLSAESPEFAEEATRFYLRWRKDAEAERHLAHFPEGWRPGMQALRQAQLLELRKDYAPIPALLTPHVTPGSKVVAMRQLLVTAHASLGDLGEAKRTMLDWLTTRPGDEYAAQTTLAEALKDRFPAEAVIAYDKAFGVQDPQWHHVLARIECLIRLGETVQARGALEAFAPANAAQIHAHSRLVSIL
jgi:hypothetical protein